MIQVHCIVGNTCILCLYTASKNGTLQERAKFTKGEIGPVLEMQIRTIKFGNFALT